MKKKNISTLGRKATFLIIIFAVILGTSTIAFTYHFYCKSTDEQFVAMGENAVIAASSLLDANKIAQYGNTFKKDSYYNTMTTMLENFSIDENILHVFIFKPSEQGQVFIYNSSLSQNKFYLGYTCPWYDSLEEHKSAFMTGCPVTPLESEDEKLGCMLTIYQPMYDSNGNVVAYAGVDLSQQGIIVEKENFLLFLLLLIGGITFAFSLLYMLFVRKFIVNPINKMATAADAYLFEQGNSMSMSTSNFSNLGIHSQDELGVLASSLSAMEHKINDYVSHLEVATTKAETDSMTGLFNREAFQSRVNSILRSSNHEQQMHAFLMMDLDYFKQINDTYGHIIGDEVLIKTAEAMKSIVRSGDVLARMGGDEFAIFLYSVNTIENVSDKANALLKKISDIKIDTHNINDKVVTVSASIGIAMCPKDGNSAAELYERADTALYASKSYKKGSFKFVKSP